MFNARASSICSFEGMFCPYTGLYFPLFSTFVSAKGILICGDGCALAASLFYTLEITSGLRAAQCSHCRTAMCSFGLMSFRSGNEFEFLLHRVNERVLVFPAESWTVIEVSPVPVNAASY